MGKDVGEIGQAAMRIADSIARPSPRITLRISSSPTRGNPLAIIRGYGELNRRQSAVLEQLPEFGSRAIVGNNFGQRDLVALTAATGDEFAMFSVGGRRLIIRGAA